MVLIVHLTQRPLTIREKKVSSRPNNPLEIVLKVLNTKEEAKVRACSASIF